MTTAQRATATRMLTSKGQALTISVPGTGSYDPATGTNTQTPTTVTTTGCLFPLDKSRKVDGTAIVQGDETLLLSALDDTGQAYTEPKVGSVVTLADASKRVIVAIDVLAPAGLAIMFDAVVRKK